MILKIPALILFLICMTVALSTQSGQTYCVVKVIGLSRTAWKEVTQSKPMPPLPVEIK